MARPCLTQHPLSPDSCRLCHWCMDGTAKGKAYRERWGEPESPTLVERALNFTAAVAGHAASGMATAPAEEVSRRLSVCLTSGGGGSHCPQLVTKDGRPSSCRDRRCGCNLPLKASWSSQRCPLGLW